MKNEIEVMAEAIIRQNDGQAYFNFGQASKIVGCDRGTMAHHLHQAGILVKQIGPSKRISAYDIAALMCRGRVAPIDNTSRPTPSHVR